MSVAGYNHQDTEDCLGIDTYTTQPNTVATVYIGQAYADTPIELTLDELRAFSEQIKKTLSELEAKQAQASA